MSDKYVWGFLTSCNHSLKVALKQFKIVLSLKTKFEKNFNDIFLDIFNIHLTIIIF